MINEGYQVKEGINDKQISQLIYFSNTDPSVKCFTSDCQRFANHESFLGWTKKGRTVYTLTDSDNNLCGIMWFGKKQMPARQYKSNIDRDKYPFTFSIRIYENARGKGLSEPFMRNCFERYMSGSEYLGSVDKNFWLECTDSNIPGKKLYTKFGFWLVSEPDENRKIIMVWEK